MTDERGHEDEILEVCHRWGLHTEEIGTVTDDGLLDATLVPDVPLSGRVQRLLGALRGTLHTMDGSVALQAPALELGELLDRLRREAVLVGRDRDHVLERATLQLGAFVAEAEALELLADFGAQDRQFFVALPPVINRL